MPQSDTRSLNQIKHETECTRAELTQTVAELRSSVTETSRDIRERIKLYRRPSAAADIVELVLGDERLARERAS